MDEGGPAWKLLTERAERAGALLGAHLQIADRCNHVCVHCYQVQGEKAEMSFEQVCKVLDDLAAAGTLLLTVSGGEATLRPDLIEILAHARSRNFAITLYTNGFLIDDTLAMKLAAVGLREVQISVYSSLPAEHDAVTGVPGSYERTIGAARRLRALGVPVMLKTVVMRDADRAFEGVRDLAQRMGCRHRTTVSLSANETGDVGPIRLGVEPAELVRRGLLAAWSPDSEPRENELNSAPCGVCSSQATILANGEVRPCQLSAIPLGNAIDTPVGTIVSTRREVTLLRGLRWNDVHGCRSCDLRGACSRCHADAAAEGGDYLGPYASACETAIARYAGSVGAVRIMEPEPAQSPASEAVVGPFRIVERGVLRPIADERTPADDAVAAEFSWVRPGGRFYQSAVQALSGVGLVQLGRRRAEQAGAIGEREVSSVNSLGE